jgi:hypothetical protein
VIAPPASRPVLEAARGPARSQPDQGPHRPVAPGRRRQPRRAPTTNLCTGDGSADRRRVERSTPGCRAEQRFGIGLTIFEAATKSAPNEPYTRSHPLRSGRGVAGGVGCGALLVISVRMGHLVGALGHVYGIWAKAGVAVPFR